VLDFSSWSQLVFGGDDTDYFAESDDDITAGSGITGIVNSTSPFITIGRGVGAVLMAGYVNPVTSVGPAWPDFDIFKKLEKLIRESRIDRIFPPDRGDPSPEDIIRLKIISESLDLVRGGKVTDVDAFEGLLGAAKKMSPAELKRTITGTRATLLRGQAALKSIEALAKRKQTGR
jgi:hypothetical protein